MIRPVPFVLFALAACVPAGCKSDPPAPEPVTFPLEAHLQRDGKAVTIPCWVRATPDEKQAGFYLAQEWGPDPFPGCTRVGEEYHYKTAYPMALLPGPNGEGAVIVKFN